MKSASKIARKDNLTNLVDEKNVKIKICKVEQNMIALILNNLSSTIASVTCCMCVCLYSSNVKASSVCKMSKTYFRVRINDLVL